MFKARILAVISLGIITALTNPLGRDKRQSDTEGNVGLVFSSKEYCSLKMDVDVSNITQVVTNGIPSPDYCEHFVLQCETVEGNVTSFVEECGVGLWWSFTSNSCEIPSLSGRYHCSAMICPPYGIVSVADKRACYGHYECQDGTPFYEFCEEGGFNPETLVCELPTTCELLTPYTGVNGSDCTEADLPEICPIPGYMPSLILCGCVHQDWEL